MFIIQNKRTKDFIDNNGGWTCIRSFAKRYETKEEAQKYVDQNEVRGDESYMNIIKEEAESNTEQIANQQEVIRDLQTQLGTAETEDEKKSIRLKLDVANAKLREIQGQASNEPEEGNVQEESTYQKTHFLEEEHPADCDCPECKEQLDESLPSNYSKSRFLNKDIPEAIKTINALLQRVQNDAKKYYALSELKFDFSSIETFARQVKDNCKDLDSYETKGTLSEGCMSKKFENMTNRELANYIFRHPHTKFGDKMKECDTAEIMKAIRDMKKADEDVTTTAAIATAPKPSMYMKRPEQEELRDEE